jgi:hypothetical protein
MLFQPVTGVVDRQKSKVQTALDGATGDWATGRPARQCSLFAYIDPSDTVTVTDALVQVRSTCFLYPEGVGS